MTPLTATNHLPTVREDFLVFGAPVLGEEEIAEVVATLRSGWLGTGPRVQQFEREFMACQRAGFAVGVNSCTAALHLSLLAAGIGPGDEVITTPLTFVATVNAILHTGATPVLADVDEPTMNLDPALAAARITPRTKAIVPVHFAGRPCDMVEITSLARQHGLTIVEDCAHAFEAEIMGHRTGTFGAYGCYSFYATKNICTGEGGMVLARSEADAQRIRCLALHGLSRDAWKRFGAEGFKHYQAVECGFKYNMMDLQAAIGIHQLRRVESNWLRRRELWDFYQSALADLPITLPAAPQAGTRHAFHLFPILIDPRNAGVSRDQCMAAMVKQNIGVGVHYLSVPEHPYYQEALGWRAEDYPTAMRIGRQTLSLPFTPTLTERDADDVVRALRRALHVA